ncbi:flagellar basal body rod protein FlgB [Amorphus sp. 3PC139-8]|uniref:flagellar basal body rod protein FlgB n=1 Tax=Amorphus sp. 3PC139-8 TaxID=2735676 RepID=UPI00345DAB34
MEPVHLFGLVRSHAEWASVRQATISANIANADTPGFKAKDIEPFAAALDKTRLTMAATRPGHIGVEATALGTSEAGKAESWDITHSGNSVSMDQELAKAAEVQRVYSLDTSIARSFHRMFLTSVRTSG